MADVLQVYNSKTFEMGICCSESTCNSNKYITATSSNNSLINIFNYNNTQAEIQLLSLYCDASDFLTEVRINSSTNKK